MVRALAYNPALLLSAGSSPRVRGTVAATFPDQADSVIAMFDAQEKTDFAFLAKANILTGTLADLLLRDYHHLARQPIFRSLYRAFASHDHQLQIFIWRWIELQGASSDSTSNTVSADMEKRKYTK